MLLRSGYRVGIPAGLLNEPLKSKFEEAVGILFSRWTALQLAVENSWGGDSSKEKAEDLEQEVIQWFYTGREHYVDDLEILLDEAMSYDFNTQCEDSSPHEVANTLVKLYLEVREGKTETLDRVRAYGRPNAAACQRQVVDLDGAVLQTVPGNMGEDSSSDDEDGMEDDDDEMGEGGAGGGMDDEAPVAGPIVDEDGFQMVTKPGRRRR